MRSAQRCKKIFHKLLALPSNSQASFPHTNQNIACNPVGNITELEKYPLIANWMSPAERPVSLI